MKTLENFAKINTMEEDDGDGYWQLKKTKNENIVYTVIPISTRTNQHKREKRNVMKWKSKDDKDNKSERERVRKRNGTMLSFFASLSSFNFIR